MKDAHRLAGVDLNLLVVLDELLRARSTTVAARRLGRTQSAISHALARLRATLDDPLFVRAGASLRPTALAERMQAPLRDVLVAAQSLVSRSKVAFDPASIDRTFAVSCTDYAEIAILPRLVPRLRKEAPGVDVVTRFLGDDVERAVQSREIDLGYGTRMRALTGTVVESVLDDTLTVLLRKGHPALKGKWNAARYAGLDHVLCTPRGLPGGLVDSAMEPLGLGRRVVVRMPHFVAAAMVVAKTDLVVTLPSGLVRALDRRLGLVTMPVPFPVAHVTFCIHFSASLRDDPGHKWFREQFVAAARG